jgi:cell fate regulator YaaT (PSP1 superfamily)
MSETKLIGVQFKPIGKSYHFSMPEDMDVNVGEYVVVNTAYGKQIGRVTRTDLKQLEVRQEIQAIERLASPRDLMLKDMIKQKEAEAVEKIKGFIEDSTYEGVKAIDAEYSFDSTKLTLYLSYDNVPDFNMRSFIREAAPMFPETRIEIRQVGPRDMAKEISGLGACGIEKRCCSRFLTEFSSISIRMAKSQNVSLTPSEITGICGRLRCCLAYEHEAYEEARKLLPKVKKVITTPLGEGKVVQVLPLTDSVVVNIPGLGYKEVTRQELESGKMQEKKAPEPEYPDEFESDQHDVELVSIGNERAGSDPKAEESTNKRSRSRKNRGKRSSGKAFDNDQDTSSQQSQNTPGDVKSKRYPSRRKNRSNKPSNQNQKNG